MTYGILACGNSGTCNILRIKRIENNFNKLLAMKRLPHQNTNFKFLNFDSLYDSCSLLKFYRCFKTSNHLYFKNSINNLLPSHDYRTRFNTDGNVLLPSYRLASTQEGFFFKSISTWNSLPNDLKSET